MKKWKGDILTEETIRRLKKSGIDIISIIFSRPKHSADVLQWFYYNEKLKKIYKIMASMSLIWKDFIFTEIPEIAALANKETAVLLRKFRRVGAVYQPKAFENLMHDAIEIYDNSLNRGAKEIKRYFRMTQQYQLAEQEINLAMAKGLKTGTPEGIQRELYKALERRLIDGKIHIVKEGVVTRSYRPDTYAELVARTRISEAQTQSVIQTAQEYGQDLVRITDHMTQTPVCLHYEGRVFSLSGNNAEFPLLDRRPPFHPNCLHGLTVFIMAPKNTSTGRAQRARIEKVTERDEKFLAEIAKAEEDTGKKYRPKYERAEPFILPAKTAEEIEKTRREHLPR